MSDSKKRGINKRFLKELERLSFQSLFKSVGINFKG